MGIHLGNQEVLFNNIQDNSIDAIITDPPYSLIWDHKIETHFNFENFINNSYRVLKDKGFLVYFGQEPTISMWNVLTQKKLYYLTEIIWYKRRHSAPYHYPLRVHEKIMIFTKKKGTLNKTTIDWVHEKEEIADYMAKETLLSAISEIKKLLKTSKDIEELKAVVNGATYEVTKSKSGKVNDDIYKMPKYKYISRANYLLNKKRLSTLWGCVAHNHQGYNSEEFNIKHPTVKPVQIIERLLEMTTSENQIVLDPFMGSGTTGVACNSLKRGFIGFEILEDYYKIAEHRLGVNCCVNNPYQMDIENYL